ncbi:MAG: TonB-dependent receptor [Steroidobacteraceae bacterium]
MFIRKPGFALGAVGLLAFGDLVGAAHAAEAEDTLEEVVVTAEKRETNLQKTAISIQVYSGEELKKDGKKRIDEIMSGVVGVQSQGSQVGSNFYMRGVDAGGGGGSASAVAVLIDGVYQTRSETVRGGTLDMAQVEVMRGTQSTNLGASSLAGAVSLVSNQPVFEYQSSGNLEVGNYNLLAMEGVLNLPLSSDQALRVAYSSNKRDGYLSSGAGDSDLQNARLKYRIKFGDDVDLVTTVNHQVIGGNGVSDGVLLYTGHWEPYNGQVTMSGCNPTTTTTYFATMGCPVSYVAVADGVTYKDRSNPWDDGLPANAWSNNPYRHTVINTYSADLNWNTGIGKLTATPSVQTASYLSTEPARGTSWHEEDQDQPTDQIDVRLTSNADSKLEWLAGAYYMYTNLSNLFANVYEPGATGQYTCAATSASDCYTYTSTKYNKQTTISAYTDMTYPLTDTFRLKGGLRYSHDKKNFAITGAAVDGTRAGPTEAFDYVLGGASWQAVTYRGGVEYDVLPQSMAYAMYSTGYQPGTVNTTNITGTKKLELEQITLGLKNRFFDDKLQANVEFFNSQYHNRAIQGSLSPILDQTDTTVSCGGPPGTPTGASVSDTNACLYYAGAATIPNLLSRGVDLEVNWLPTAQDRIDFSAEFLKSIYEDSPDVPSYSAAQILSLAGITAPTAAEEANAETLAASWKSLVAQYAGLTLQNSPKWTLNATYSHTFSLTNGSTLTPRVNGVYKTRYWTAGGQSANAVDPGDSYQEAYALWNAYLTWQSSDGKFSVAGNVKNIANKPIMTDYGGTYVALDAPRTFSISFNANL